MSLTARHTELLKKEKAEIIKTAKENNIPLNEIGLSEEDDDDYDDDYTSIARSYGATFVINGLGYLTCGENGGSGMTTCWEYNPAKDLWTERSPFEAGTRSEAIGFSLNNRGFVLTGKSGTYQYDDMWEFFPRDEADEND